MVLGNDFACVGNGCMHPCKVCVLCCFGFVQCFDYGFAICMGVVMGVVEIGSANSCCYCVCGSTHTDNTHTHIA